MNLIPKVSRMGLLWKCGDVSLHLWPPVTVLLDLKPDEDGWYAIRFAWVWSWQGRWQFPKDPTAAYGRPDPLVVGWNYGPVDIRVVQKVPD